MTNIGSGILKLRKQLLNNINVIVFCTLIKCYWATNR